MAEFDAVVVGAGAAGMMCAGRAAQRGGRVLLLERNPRPGRKLMITGKGRCNVTNFCDTADFLAAVRRNPRFLYSALGALSPYDTYAFFEELGVPLKIERGDRVYPQSDRAVDIVDALAGWVKAQGVRIAQGRAERLLMEGGRAAGVATEEGKELRAAAVVVATGGMSYPLTGSTGDGYRLAGQAGHGVTPLHPSLIPLTVREDWCRDLMGLSLRNVTLTAKAGEKVLFSSLGEMLFTHFGVSGPLVLSASAHLPWEHLSGTTLHIDLKPGLDHHKLDARLLRDFEENRNRDFSNALGALLPRKLIPVAVRLSGIAPGTKVNAVTREQRLAFGALLKDLTLTVTGTRPLEEAVVTSGGVEVDGVRPNTMESRLLPGLYFAGEVLDLDAYTGGYNLQIAFSTGWLAGQSLPVGTGAKGETS